MGKNKVYWETKDGNRVNIDEMDIDHLRNVLKMIVRRRKKQIRNHNTEPYAFDYLWK